MDYIVLGQNKKVSFNSDLLHFYEIIIRMTSQRNKLQIMVLAFFLVIATSHAPHAMLEHMPQRRQ